MNQERVEEGDRVRVDAELGEEEGMKERDFYALKYVRRNSVDRNGYFD